MIEIKGIKKSGLNAASKTIPLQFQGLIKQYNEISSCFQGTINIQLENELIILNPDKRTLPIKWHNDAPAEVFDFLKVKLCIPRLNVEKDAWIYIAHNSVHRNRYNFHELICEKIENLSDCENMKIRISRNSLVLPYGENRIYIV